MKKLAATLLILFLIFSVTISQGEAPAAVDVDLSAMSFDQLVSLREQLNLAIWNCQEWQEVTVPKGVYQVGVDIPAGHWSIRVAAPIEYLYVSYFDKLNDMGDGLAPGGRLFQVDIASHDYEKYRKSGSSYLESTDINMEDGWYFKCGGAVIFTPYTGKPDLGFK